VNIVTKVPVVPYSAVYSLEIPKYGRAPNSTGGGRGGYSNTVVARNPLTSGPGSCLWAGDGRQNLGGLGGRPLTGSQFNLYFGGGGGAGHDNDGCGGSGGRGGGLVFIVAGKLVTPDTTFVNPTITANGADGQSSSGCGGLYDGAGGGGAGGTVYLQLSPTHLPQDFSSNIVVSAKGGNGGSVLVVLSAETDGVGGSGGGGAVYTNVAITANVSAGAAGKCTSTTLAQFPPNGATNGCNGDQSGLICTAAPAGTPSSAMSKTINTSTTPSPSIFGSSASHSRIPKKHKSPRKSRSRRRSHKPTPIIDIILRASRSPSSSAFIRRPIHLISNLILIVTPLFLVLF